MRRLDGSAAVNGARFSYGDFFFPESTQIDFKLAPRYDDSGRFVVGMNLRIKATFLFIGQDNANLTGDLTSVRSDSLHYALAILRSPRQPLILTGLPYGNWYVEAGRTYNNNRADDTIEAAPKDDDTYLLDNANGPLPVGDVGIQCLNQEARILTWEVEANVPPLCVKKEGQTITYAPYGLSGNNYALLGVEDVTYAVTIQQVNGYTVRTIQGVIRRVGSYYNDASTSPLGSPRPTGRRYFEDRGLYVQTEIDKIFPLLDGYKRTYPSIVEDPSKLTLQFTITDEELQSDNPYEVGCSMLSAPYSIQSSDKGFFNWSVQLDVDLEVAPNYPKTWGYYVFVRIFYDLAKRAALRVTTVPESDPTSGNPVPRERVYLETEETTKKTGKPFVLLTSLGLREDRFTRKMQFSASWDIVNLDLLELLSATGFGQPAELNSTWERWHESLKTSVHRATGYSPLGEPIDYYVDFCKPVKTASDLPYQRGSNNTGTITKQVENSTLTLYEGDDGKEKSLRNKVRPNNDPLIPPPAPPEIADNEGYLHFKNEIMIRRGIMYSANYVLDDSGTDLPQDWGGTDVVPGVGGNPFTGGLAPASAVPYEPTEQGKRDKPDVYYVIMTGFIVRHTKEPIVPTLLKVGSANANLLKETVTPTITTTKNIEGKKQKIFTYRWVKLYKLDRPPVGNTVVSSHVINPSDN